MVYRYSRRQILTLTLSGLGAWWWGHSAGAQAGIPRSPHSLVEAPVNRVASLTTLTADILYRLAPDKLVGIPSGQLLESDPRFQGITRLGLGNQPNLEQLVALQPDWVVGASGFHDALASRLEELGIPTYLTAVNSWAALEETITTLAAALGVDPQPLLQEYGALLPQQLPPSQPKTLLLAGTQPILSPNRQSWAGDLLERFGADNLTATLQSQGQFRGYVTLSAERILEANPEILLVVNPEAADPLAFFQSRPFWDQLQAVQTQRVYGFDYYGLVNPGSLDKIKVTCERLAQVFGSG
ncbi:ABC transporter substrate-binding protein [Thermostichus vulcanus]|uniref:ABC transporter substrate-binding protein n=1 Tax=Thermostichus vulcanus str. 'Rupite' TaxID=2813851 RepID=A0ABT0CBC2_THEVL|nr:ABC transporter substrate-binding protein [Thermostichus vulcanus]MCJ2543081.1 ABC transporter substrate-binding protein [Thermostichus vulcanus str. 'Rupite']